MAITPKQALGDKPAREAEKKVELEKHIDKCLSENFYGNNPITIDVSGHAFSVVATVIEKYRQSGWIVQKISHPRSELMLEFRPASPIEQAE